MPAQPADVFVKRRLDAPAYFFDWEAAGLDWLRATQSLGGVRVVGVREVGDQQIVLNRIDQAPASPAAARAFALALAKTHDAGADGFGCGPPGWSGDGFIGRQVLPLQRFSRWGAFYAETRLLPYAHAATRAGTLDDAGLGVVETVCDRLRAGEYDDGNPPARIHGDLWGGNVLYSGSRAGLTSAVLIDPAAHGGHRLTDLAMLALFGTEHLELVLETYADTAALSAGWRELIGLHQLHPLLVHAVTHGPSYGRQAHKVAVEYA